MRVAKALAAAAAAAALAAAGVGAAGAEGQGEEAQVGAAPGVEGVVGAETLRPAGAGWQVARAAGWRQGLAAAGCRVWGPLEVVVRQIQIQVCHHHPAAGAGRGAARGLVAAGLAEARARWAAVAMVAVEGDCRPGRAAAGVRVGVGVRQQAGSGSGWPLALLAKEAAGRVLAVGLVGRRTALAVPVQLVGRMGGVRAVLEGRVAAAGGESRAMVAGRWVWQGLAAGRARRGAPAEAARSVAAAATAGGSALRAVGLWPMGLPPVTEERPARVEGLAAGAPRAEGTGGWVPRALARRVGGGAARVAGVPRVVGPLEEREGAAVTMAAMLVPAARAALGVARARATAARVRAGAGAAVMMAARAAGLM